MNRLKVEEKDLDRLNNVLRCSNTVIDMYDSISAERRADAELTNGSYDEPDIIDVIRGLIFAASRYSKFCDETYYSLENSSKYGIDYSVYYKKMTRDEFNEIVVMTFSALQCLEHNVIENNDVKESE